MKKFLAVACVLIVAVLWPTILIGTIAQQRLFTAEMAKQLIRDSQIGERLPKLIIASWLADGSGEDNPLGTGIDPAQTQDLLEQALPPEDLYTITDEAITTTATWWHTGAPLEKLPLVLDFGVIKENLTPVVVQSFEKYIEELPVCSAEELNYLTYDQDGLPDFSTMSCRPEGLTLDNYRDKGWSDHLLAQILLFEVPTEINIQTMLQEQAESNPTQVQIYNQQIDQLRQGSQIARLFLWFGWGVIALSLVVVMLLRHRPLFSMFGWLGAIGIIVTLETLLPALFGWFLPQFISFWLKNISDPFVAELLGDVLTNAVYTLVHPLWWVAIATAIFSVVCFVTRGIIKARNVTSSPAKS